MTIKIKKLNLELHNFHLFIITTTIIKVILMGLCSSDYQNQMFMPFVQRFITGMQSEIKNPYEYYYMNDLIPSFPYPPLMLLIESIGGGILYICGTLPIFFTNIIFKIPSLVFDFIGMYYLMKLCPKHRKYIGVFYFASPIMIYATYMHGQLDVIPSTFLIGAIYYITCKQEKKEWLFVIMLTAALATKLHILAVLPILFIYLLKRDGLKKAIKLIGFTLILLMIIILPFMSNGFIKSVIFNNEQQVLTQVFFSFVNIKLYVPILAVLFIYLSAFNLNNINTDLLISFCGILFAVFLALVPPMPGWYVWIIPFVTIFFVEVKENRYKSMIIYLLLNGFYILYFMFFHHTEYADLYFLNMDLSVIKNQSSMIGNVVFTILTALLIYSTYLMYQLGVTSNALYKRRNLPFTIGIAGDSGSGKSTFIELMKECLGIDNLLFIEGDGDHRWERGEEMWKKYTHLNPKANYLYRQAMDIQVLRTGNYVKRVEYDHDTGKFTSEQKIRPKRYIIMCGLHSLYLPQMRKNLDLKIYMDSDETLRRYWKIQRDTRHRGYTKERIIEQIESRMSDAHKYIKPQKAYADLIIHYFDKNLVDCCVENHDIIISLKLTLSAVINIEPIMQYLACYGIKMEYDYSDDLKMQTIIFDGESMQNKIIPFKQMAESIIPQLDEITIYSIDDTDNIQGIIKLVLLTMISHKMKGDM